MCALGSKRPNHITYRMICLIQDLLQDKALILWYVNLNGFKICKKHASLNLKVIIIFQKCLGFSEFKCELVYTKEHCTCNECKLPLYYALRHKQ